jgi:AcrR family transcriptional regulator
MIAQEVGIDISTLHYHWGEKKDLYEAVILATSPDTILPGRMIVANSADLGVHKARRTGVSGKSSASD